MYSMSFSWGLPCSRRMSDKQEYCSTLMCGFHALDAGWLATRQVVESYRKSGAVDPCE